MSNLINPGKHRARCRSVQLGFSNGGKEQAAVEFDLIDPNDPDNGRSITSYMFFHGGALEYTIANLRTLGWSGNDPATLPDDCAAGKLGNEVDLVVVHDVYNGKTSAKIKFINRIGAGMKRPMDEAQRREFGAGLRNRIAEMNVPAASGTFDDAPPPGDDDIPF